MSLEQRFEDPKVRGVLEFRNQPNLLENTVCLVSFRADLEARTEYFIKTVFYFRKKSGILGVLESQKISKR